MENIELITINNKNSPRIEIVAVTLRLSMSICGGKISTYIIHLSSISIKQYMCVYLIINFKEIENVNIILFIYVVQVSFLFPFFNLSLKY